MLVISLKTLANFFPATGANELELPQRKYCFIFEASTQWELSSQRADKNT